jgi:hypothetical protein
VLSAPSRSAWRAFVGPIASTLMAMPPCVGDRDCLLPQGDVVLQTMRIVGHICTFPVVIRGSARCSQPPAPWRSAHAGDATAWSCAGWRSKRAARLPACATTAAAAGQVELLTGIEGASSRPVRRIVLVGW